MNTISWDEFSLDQNICGDTSNKTTDLNEGIPYGTYHVSVASLTLKKSQKGQPLLACKFNILDNAELEGKSIHMFTLLLRDGGPDDLAFVIRCNNFLRSLRMVHDEEIALNQQTGVAGYAKLVDEIFAHIEEHNPTYALEFAYNEGPNGKKYNTFLITDVFMD